MVYARNPSTLLLGYEGILDKSDLDCEDIPFPWPVAKEIIKISMVHYLLLDSDQYCGRDGPAESQYHYYWSMHG